MHPNPAFRSQDDDRDLAFLRQRSFGSLVATKDSAIHLAHVPFLLSGDGQHIDLHLVRSNPIARMAGPVPVVLSVMGPDGYVSPDWYGVEDQVPTWNYVNVEVVGELEALDPSTLDDMLARQTAAFENGIAGKTPWTLDKLSAEAHRRLSRMILPFRMTVDELRSTWKLNQNKPPAAIEGAAAQIASTGLGLAAPELADFMRAELSVKLSEAKKD